MVPMSARLVAVAAFDVDAFGCELEHALSPSPRARQRARPAPANLWSGVKAMGEFLSTQSRDGFSTNSARTIALWLVGENFAGRAAALANRAI